MSTEWFAAVPLPVSTEAGAAEHVRVFISPTLRPDGGTGLLGDFATFRDWAAAVKDGTTVTLMDQHGEFEAEPDTSGIDPGLWSRAFGPDTPVRENRVPEWQDRTWRTFGAKDASDLAKAVHLATIATDPVNPPAPSAHPFVESLIGIARENGAFRSDRRGELPEYDESELTAALDRLLEAGRQGAWSTGLAGEGPVRLDGFDGMWGALQVLHRVRRFYERPESRAPSQVVQNPPEKVTPLVPPVPEFHERVAAAGDHPGLLRRLGLLLPLRADAGRLATSEWLAATVRLQAPEGTCRSPRLAVRALADGGFVSVTNPQDPPAWVDGALALGDPAMFDVLDIDADGSAIKAERYLTTFPRYVIAQQNKTPVHAASPALRATGLTVARRQQAGRAQTQLDRQEELQTRLEFPDSPLGPPQLYAQDVTRGMRVEVWDSVTGVWRSLHSRLSTLTVQGESVYTDEPEEGYIQGTNATETHGVEKSAIHVHEAMFGWDGWSLSAPRPGKRVRAVITDAPGGGSRIDEAVEQTPVEVGPDEPPPPHPFVFTHRAAPGTLPRLRYGRDYSFRAWAVDLAGTVRNHHVGFDPEHLAAVDQAAAPFTDAVLGERLSAAVRLDGHAVRQQLPDNAGILPEGLPADEPVTDGPADIAAPLDGEQLLDALDADALRHVAGTIGLSRDVLNRRLPVRGAPETPDAATADLPGLDLRSLGPRGVAALRARTTHVPSPGTTARLGATSRAAAASSAIRAASLRGEAFASTVVTEVEVWRKIAAGHLVDLLPGVAGADVGHAGAEAVDQALGTITPPRPFLRWDPVPTPAVVPITAFTEGESVNVLVVRSGVHQDPVSLEVTVTDPEAYASSTAATDPPPAAPYAGTNSRHLAPPKTSQLQAELHGVFDPALEAGTAEGRRQALGWALRESGTFFDQSVPHSIDPAGEPSPQPGVRLLPEPAGSDHFNPHDPAKPLKVLPPGDPETPPELVLHPGDAPAPGQYVVHDTPALTLPYLPDPLAVGASLTFAEAGADRSIAFPWGTENITARYPGTWPELQPFRLTLGGATALGASIDGHEIEVRLPAGDVQTFRLSSSIPRDRLDWMGVWRHLSEVLRSDEDVREAAADGLLWSLTPGDTVRLVHAVPRPVLAPRPIGLRVQRTPGSSLATLLGGVEVHGPSTDQLTVTVAWTDLVDDPSLPAPEMRTVESACFTTSVQPHERIVPLWPVDQVVTEFGDLAMHAATHQFPDTKHHVARYRFRASTRFREFFSPSLLAAEAGHPVDDGVSVISGELELSVPSTARPDAPLVHSVLPLFRWGEGEEPEQPFARRRTRASGVRIYLGRGWESSGLDELLAVLLAAPGGSRNGYPVPENSADGFEFISQWGSDPIWNAPRVDQRDLPLITLDHVLTVTGMDDVRESGRPVTPPVVLPLPLPAAAPGAVASGPPVLAVGYRPQFSEARKLWYVDVAFDAGATFWPFVRLAVARYQPESVAGMHLSTPVRLDYVQLAPERTASVSRTDATHVRVVVAGFAGHRDPHDREVIDSVTRNRTVVARLQRHDPTVGGDLGWISGDAVELRVRGTGRQTQELVWVGELEAEEPMDVRTPVRAAEDSAAGTAPDGARWRVRIEEWERFQGDPPTHDEMVKHGEAGIWEKRLVYADDFYL